MDEWVCGQCRSVNLKYASSCYSCATPRRLAEAAYLQANSPTAQPAMYSAPPAAAVGGVNPAAVGAAGPVAGGIASVDAPAAAFAPGIPIGSSNLLGGLAGGLLAAVIATVVWYGVVAISGWQVGFIAVGVGWLVGTGTVLGAGGRGSFLHVVSSGLFTIVALAISEYLIVFHFASQAFGLVLGDLLQSPDFMLEVVVESLAADPLTLLFWGIALLAAAGIPFRAIAGTE